MNKEEIQKSLYLLELRKSQVSALAKQLELIEFSANENLRAKETLLNYKKSGKNAEMLVPVGGDVFIFATPKNNSKAVSSVGAGVALEGSIDDIVKRIDDKLKMLNDAGKKIVEGMEKTQNEIDNLSEKIERMYSKLRNMDIHRKTPAEKPSVAEFTEIKHV
ncbi:MAG: prefoldin subunit alpha [Thermoplasmatales archaeon]|nr:prefoldin subunit alpha [Thermoplasmatales archaeon]